jgi:hypothetical protein
MKKEQPRDLWMIEPPAERLSNQFERHWCEQQDDGP